MSQRQQSVTAGATTAEAAEAPRSRILIASMVGTTIEFYDFYVYATAAVAVFPYLFFPKGNGTTALLASLATFGLAFVARPLGSILFGHFGDRIGRKATLVGSLLTMGIATVLIGCLPTYHQIGLLAPALLAVLRFAQGLALGGEWSGAALLAVETARPEKRGWAAVWPQMGAPLGFLLANGVFLALILSMGQQTAATGSDSWLLNWAWRIPFLLSAVMVVIGLYVRLRLTETPVFRRALQRGERVQAPLTQVFKTSLPQLIIGTFVMVATYTLFYIVTTWMLSYIIGPRPPKGSGLGLQYAEALKLQLIAVLFFAATLPVTGWLSDRFGRRRPLLVITAGIMAFGALFGPLLAGDRASTATVLIFLIIGMSLMGLTFGPMSAVLPELFPTNVRYTGSGISYNAASILGAAVAPFIAAWLVAHYGVAYVGLYLALAAAVTFVALLVMKETSQASLDGAEPVNVRRET